MVHIYDAVSRQWTVAWSLQVSGTRCHTPPPSLPFFGDSLPYYFNGPLERAWAVWTVRESRYCVICGAMSPPC